MSEILYDIVNEEDEIKGKASREDIHRKGLVHRSIVFYILDRQGRIFVNQRTANKESYPEHWSIVLGGHVQSGETYEEAVMRELKEEANIRESPVFIANFKKRFDEDDKENMRVYAFVTDRQPEPDPEEIKQGRFMTIEEAEQILKRETFLPETTRLFHILKNIDFRASGFPAPKASSRTGNIGIESGRKFGGDFTEPPFTPHK